MSSLNQKNVQVQYVYQCCLFLIFDQTIMVQEQVLTIRWYDFEK